MFKTVMKASVGFAIVIGATTVAPTGPIGPSAAEAKLFTKNCGGLGQKTCITPIKKNRCNSGLVERSQPGRNICVRKSDLPATASKCGGLNQTRCRHINPAKWCNPGLKLKVQFGGLDTCIKKVTNKDRLDVATSVIREIGTDNALGNLTKCVKRPAKLGELRTAIKSRSNGGVNRVLRSCGADLAGLQSMGKMSALNNGAEGGNDKFFKTLSITVGGSGAYGVAGAAGAGIVIELNKNPNARWFFTGGVGGGPKAEVVGDVTLGLSRSPIPTKRLGFDHGIGAVVSGHYIVGLSGGVEFEGNSLDFNGISIGAGGGVGVGGAIYKTGAVFPFKDL